MSSAEEQTTFFDRERDRLAKEITSGFEELLSSSNGLNRKLEEVLGMTKEYDTIASLWHSFYQLMKDSNNTTGSAADSEIPGTGGHIVSSANRKPEDNN